MPVVQGEFFALLPRVFVDPGKDAARGRFEGDPHGAVGEREDLSVLLLEGDRKELRPVRVQRNDLACRADPDIPLRVGGYVFEERVRPLH